MSVYYNENDAFAAAWLAELMKNGLIPHGEIDTRSIADVTAADVRGFTQVHFFAGIGGWAYALALAGWDDHPAWTGSCPCQPFSAAGKRQGTADKRHLWPEMRRLVAECAPSVVFGEQVASKDGRVWLAGVRADMEALGYGVGAADLCAAGVGAPHIRQRLYWVADSNKRPEGLESRSSTELRQGRTESHAQLGLGRCSANGSGLADAEHAERRAKREINADTHRRNGLGGRSDLSGLVDADHQGLQGRCVDTGKHADKRTAWSSGEFIPCADGKARRVEPGIFPLAHGVPNRVGTLRGAGNAIVPACAAEFLMAYMETLR